MANDDRPSVSAKRSTERSHMHAGSGAQTQRTSALVLAGGVALGAYEAGAFAGLEKAGDPPVKWIAGSSIGAVNAGIIAGNPPEHRLERLRQFWNSTAFAPMPVTSFWFDTPTSGPMRRAYNWAAVLQGHLFGRPGLFHPRLDPSMGIGADDAAGLYDLTPLRKQLAELIDFGRLNNGEVRLSVVATDVVTGEAVVFDTARGARIGPEHLVASSALLPVFAPIEVDGRLLGDGGLTANAPLDVILDERTTEDVVCFVVDLFARDGSRPQSLLDAVARAQDLVFGNQTRRILEGHRREHRLRAMIDRLAARLPSEVREDPDIAPAVAEGQARATIVLHLRRAAVDEIGPGKPFDFSYATLAERWEAGIRDMQTALQTLKALSRDVDAAELVVREI
jgi:NTE family protein